MQGLTLAAPVKTNSWRRCGFGRLEKQATDPLLAVADAGLPEVRKHLKKSLKIYQRDIGKAISYLMGNPERPISLYEVENVVSVVGYHLNQSSFSIQEGGPAPPWTLFKAEPSEDERNLGEILNLRAAVAAADAMNEAVFGVGAEAVRVFERGVAGLVPGLATGFEIVPDEVMRQAGVAGFGQVRYLDMYEEGVQAMRRAMVATLEAAADSELAGIAGQTGQGGLIGELRRILPQVAEPTYGLLPSQVERANRYMGDLEKQAFRNDSLNKLRQVGRRFKYPAASYAPEFFERTPGAQLFLSEEFDANLASETFFDLRSTDRSGSISPDIVRNRVGVRGRNRDILFDKKSGRTLGRVGEQQTSGLRPVTLDSKGRKWLGKQRNNAGLRFASWARRGDESAWAKAMSHELDIRVERIARTETIRVANAAYLAGAANAQNNGILPRNARMVWDVTEDDRLCARCAPMAGQIQEIGGTFESNQRLTPTGELTDLKEKWQGQHPPLHPNCRCRIVEYLPDLQITDEDLALPTGGIDFAEPGPALFPQVPPEQRGSSNFQDMVKEFEPDSGARKLTTRAVAVMSTLLKKPPAFVRGNVEVRYNDEMIGKANGYFHPARKKPAATDGEAINNRWDVRAGRTGSPAPPVIGITRQADAITGDAEALSGLAIQTFFHEYGHRIDFNIESPGAGSVAKSRFELLKNQVEAAFRQIEDQSLLTSGNSAALDEAIMRNIRGFGPLSIADSPEMEFYLAAKNSNSMATLLRAVDAGALALEGVTKTEAMTYLTNPMEIWARAFHQWVILQSTRVGKRAEVAGALKAIDDDLVGLDTDEIVDSLGSTFEQNFGGMISPQWQAEEFERDIAPLVEKVLTEWRLL